ncbi:MAG: M20 family metallopeptidase [Trueperaceae bacterium]|nr:M20 family metallopeptidase [Trueperaceae bacterium]
MNAHTFRRQASARSSSFLETLHALVALESPTFDLERAQRLADHLAALLAGDDWTVTRTETAAGALLTARLDGGDPQDGTLLLAHYDTVWPAGTLNEMPWRHEDDVVYGPGALDMKAGIVNAVHAMRLVREAGGPRGPVTLLLTPDEEAGSAYSRAAIEAEARRHARVLVLEPGREDGALKVGRKGVGLFTAHFAGRSAHAGTEPERGASAVRALAQFVLFAEGLADLDAGTTVAVTVVQGGTVTNVIAESARASVDVRFLRLAEGERVAAALADHDAAVEGVTFRLEGGINRGPMEPTPANRALAAEAQACLRAMGQEADTAVVGGVSDGNFTSALGVPTLDGLGSVGGGAHARHEHLRVQATLDRVALVAALLHGRAGQAGAP